MLFRLRYLTVFACFFFSACSSINPTSVQALDWTERNSNKNATIILSSGAEKSCFSSQLMHVQVFQEKPRRLVQSLSLNNNFLTFEYPETFGFLHAVNIPAGEYVLEVKYLGWNMQQTPSSKLTLDDKDIVYLGEIFLPGECHAFILSSLLLTSDQWERDQKKLKS